MRSPLSGRLHVGTYIDRLLNQGVVAAIGGYHPEAIDVYIADAGIAGTQRGHDCGRADEVDRRNRCANTTQLVGSQRIGVNGAADIESIPGKSRDRKSSNHTDKDPGDNSGHFHTH
ncbi:hypothetical protein JHS3_22040 [Jeongeupia sp. HS-3]|nr:hypothetical protein JHS3_22040 [Jeongeupia sp. HS-3]